MSRCLLLLLVWGFRFVLKHIYMKCSLCNIVFFKIFRLLDFSLYRTLKNISYAQIILY